MNLTTKKVIEEAVRVRRIDIIRLEHLDESVFNALNTREDQIEEVKKQIQELKEDMLKLYVKG